MKFKLQKLSSAQRLGWYGLNFTFGGILLDLVIKPHLLSSVEPWVPVAFLVVCWLFMVGVFRIYIQDKDPMNFKDLLGFKRKKQAE